MEFSKKSQTQAPFAEFSAYADKLIAEDAAEGQIKQSGFMSLDFFWWQVFVHSFHYCIIKGKV